jgi:hypothetical protein
MTFLLLYSSLVSAMDGLDILLVCLMASLQAHVNVGLFDSEQNPIACMRKIMERINYGRDNSPRGVVAKRVIEFIRQNASKNVDVLVRAVFGVTLDELTRGIVCRVMAERVKSENQSVKAVLEEKKKVVKILANLFENSTTLGTDLEVVLEKFTDGPMVDNPKKNPKMSDANIKKILETKIGELKKPAAIVDWGLLEALYKDFKKLSSSSGNNHASSGASFEEKNFDRVVDTLADKYGFDRHQAKIVSGAKIMDGKKEIGEMDICIVVGKDLYIVELKAGHVDACYGFVQAYKLTKRLGMPCTKVPDWPELSMPGIADIQKMHGLTVRFTNSSADSTGVSVAEFFGPLTTATIVVATAIPPTDFLMLASSEASRIINNRINALDRAFYQITDEELVEVYNHIMEDMKKDPGTRVSPLCAIAIEVIDCTDRTD